MRYPVMNLNSFNNAFDGKHKLIEQWLMQHWKHPIKYPSETSLHTTFNSHTLTHYYPPSLLCLSCQCFLSINRINTGELIFICPNDQCLFPLDQDNMDDYVKPCSKELLAYIELHHIPFSPLYSPALSIDKPNGKSIPPLKL